MSPTPPFSVVQKMAMSLSPPHLTNVAIRATRPTPGNVKPSTSLPQRPITSPLPPPPRILSYDRVPTDRFNLPVREEIQWPTWPPRLPTTMDSPDPVRRRRRRIPRVVAIFTWPNWESPVPFQRRRRRGTMSTMIPTLNATF